MFYDISEFGSALFVKVNKGVDLNSQKLKNAIEKLLKEYQLSYALVSTPRGAERREFTVELETKEDIQALMKNSITGECRSRKSRAIDSQRASIK
ncbi:hypothetical protein [Bacillus paralicheniformis]|uniref:hypothetical protein n=1 Tax=Bacillus paralicheniformis TaxID=1648923 RepID=UPI002DB7C25E|nr:hypothetical protein [Bacillus paralicheniformis]MEC1866741.1 hypothetical protein [Bacillus paralicheniformis]